MGYCSLFKVGLNNPHFHVSSSTYSSKIVVITDLGVMDDIAPTRMKHCDELITLMLLGREITYIWDHTFNTNVVTKCWTSIRIGTKPPSGITTIIRIHSRDSQISQNPDLIHNRKFKTQSHNLLKKPSTLSCKPPVLHFLFITATGDFFILKTFKTQEFFFDSTFVFKNRNQSLIPKSSTWPTLVDM